MDDNKTNGKSKTEGVTQSGGKSWVCCLCGKQCSGWGNDPYPLAKGEDDECCDTCNDKVTEARIRAIRH